MDAPDRNAAPSATGVMDRRLERKRWSIAGWPLAARIGLAAAAREHTAAKAVKGIVDNAS